jgi:LacI family transcriptional regulator
MATIYDVAARAGVSTATVSRVMNGTKVAPDLERAVRAAAEELAFVPSRTARTLRRQSSQVVALVIPDIENPFWTSVARGVEDRAHSAGYSVILCNTDEDPGREATYVEIALAEHISGVILAPGRDDVALSRLIARRCPVVTVDRSAKDVDVDRVVFDSEGGAWRLVRALIEDGYRRIACITGKASVETSVLRANGWREAVSGLGTQDADYLRYGDGRVDGGRAAMSDLLSLPEPPDSVFVANNLMAVGALQALAARGLSVPAFGVAVLGDLPFDVLAGAGAHTSDLPARELGAAAADLLLSRIAGDTSAARTVTLTTGPVVSPATQEA